MNRVEHLSEIREERLSQVTACLRLAKMPLNDAAKVWLDSRRPFIAENTVRHYQFHIASILKFFGNVRLEKLANPDLIRAFQVERMQTVGAAIVNKECSVIQQLLKRVRKWHEVKPFYDPLPLPPESPGRAVTAEEERRLFAAGACKPEWQVVYWAAMLSMNTAAGPAEIVGLRLQDVFVDDAEAARIFIHEHAKNKFRVREVPLNADGRNAVTALLEIVRSKGAGRPEHYLFPYRISKGEYDPTRHGNWPRSAWREMTAAAGIKLRPYDLRHSGLTKLAEKNPEQVVLKIAGPVSPHMLREVYAHVRLPALRAAVNSISSRTEKREAKKEPESGVARTAAEEAILRAAALGEKLGIPVEKALQLLMEYERQKGGK